MGRRGRKTNRTGSGWQPESDRRWSASRRKWTRRIVRWRKGDNYVRGRLDALFSHHARWQSFKCWLQENPSQVKRMENY